MSFRRDDNERRSRYDRERSPSPRYRRDDVYRPYNDRHGRIYGDRNDYRDYDRDRSHGPRQYLRRFSPPRDDFEVVPSTANDIVLDMKYRKPNGDILIGDFQRRNKDVKEEGGGDAYHEWIKTYCHCIEMKEVGTNASLFDALKWLIGFDFMQQDPNESCSQAFSASRCSEKPVIGISVNFDSSKEANILYLASPERVLAIYLNTLRNVIVWREHKRLLEAFLNSNLLLFQAWWAVECSVKLEKRYQLSFRLRDLTFGNGNKYEDLYDMALKSDGIDSNKASPFFLKRENRPPGNMVRVDWFHTEPATEAYRSALINKKGLPIINSSLLQSDIEILYEYVQTLDAQKGEDTENVRKTYELDFDRDLSGQQISEYFDPDLNSDDPEEVIRYDEAEQYTDVPHFDIYCNRLQTQPMITNSQVVHFELKYEHSDKKIYADAYGLCYETSGQRAFICFPTQLKPRTEGNFAFPEHTPRSFNMRYNMPFKKVNYLTIERISVIGKPVAPAQQKQDYKWLFDACVERENFQLRFTDTSNLLPFVDPRLSSLSFNEEENYTERQELYERLRKSSVFLHFRAPPSMDLNDQQRAAIAQIMSPKNIVVAVEGFAGTGKNKVIEECIIHFNNELNLNPGAWRSEFGNDIKPLILVLSRINASKLFIAEKDRHVSSSIVFDTRTYRRAGMTYCDANNFSTEEKTLQTLKNKTVLYATIGSFHTISKMFIKVANIQCIILEKSNLVYPLELASLLSLFPYIPKLVLCGDVKQLSPYGSERTFKKINKSVPCALQNVLGIVKSASQNRINQLLQLYVNYTVLHQSYRLPKNLLSLFRVIRYEGLLNDSEGRHIPYHQVNCANDVLFFGFEATPPLREETKVRGSTSWNNPAEADTVVKLLSLMLQVAPQLVPHTKILTFYGAQQQLITKLLKKSVKEGRNPALRQMEQYDRDAIRNLVSTLDAFQGKEADIIILCPTRSFDTHHSNNFVSDENRFTVAFSRAKKFTVFVANDKQMDDLELGKSTSHLLSLLYQNGGKGTNAAFTERITQISSEG